MDLQAIAEIGGVTERLIVVLLISLILLVLGIFIQISTERKRNE